MNLHIVTIIHYYITMSRKLIVIDGSYYIFHRFYATKRWCSLQSADSLPDFETTLFRHIENDFRKFRRTYTYMTEIWFATDCPRNEIWRRELYPEYKATRVHDAEFDRSIFDKVISYLQRESERLMLRIVGHPRLEADDLCYILSRALDTEYDQLVIIANDNDYLQLCSEKISVINKEGRHIRERGCGNASHDLLRKVLMGDKSDNIPPVCAGIGPKTADKLIVLSDIELDEWLVKRGGEGVRTRLDLNRNLVDMTRIPEEYVHEFCAQQNLIWS